MTNQAQQVVWRLENQEPFGNSPPEENPSGIGNFEFPLRFPGTYADRETGTLYNWHRDLDPTTGRYVQSDPIGLRGGINTYEYAGGTPLSYVDPSGLWTTPGHNYFIREAYPQLPPEAIRAIQEGSSMADAPLFQLPVFSYIHSMLSRSTTQEIAQARQEKFIQERLAFARNILCNPKLRARYSTHAYRAIGMATHGPTDSTSPRHGRNATYWGNWELNLNPFGIAETARELRAHAQGEDIDTAPLFRTLTINRMLNVFDPERFTCECR